MTIIIEIIAWKLSLINSYNEVYPEFISGMLLRINREMNKDICFLIDYWEMFVVHNVRLMLLCISELKSHSKFNDKVHF